MTLCCGPYNDLGILYRHALSRWPFAVTKMSVRFAPKLTRRIDSNLPSQAYSITDLLRDQILHGTHLASHTKSLRLLDSVELLPNLTDASVQENQVISLRMCNSICRRTLITSLWTSPACCASRAQIYGRTSHANAAYGTVCICREHTRIEKNEQRVIAYSELRWGYPGRYYFSKKKYRDEGHHSSEAPSWTTSSVQRTPSLHVVWAGNARESHGMRTNPNARLYVRPDSRLSSNHTKNPWLMPHHDHETCSTFGNPMMSWRSCTTNGSLCSIDVCTRFQLARRRSGKDVNSNCTSRREFMRGFRKLDEVLYHL